MSLLLCPPFSLALCPSNRYEVILEHGAASSERDLPLFRITLSAVMILFVWAMRGFSGSTLSLLLLLLLLSSQLVVANTLLWCTPLLFP